MLILNPVSLATGFSIDNHSIHTAILLYQRDVIVNIVPRFSSHHLIRSATFDLAFAALHLCATHIVDKSYRF